MDSIINGFIYMLKSLKYNQLIYIILVAGDVFTITSPQGNEENVAYYLMRCTQVKSSLVRSYEDGQFTYQASEMVVMCHPF